jgi:hypothetical protein
MTFQAIHVMQIAGNGFEVMQNKKTPFLCRDSDREKHFFSAAAQNNASTLLFRRQRKPLQLWFIFWKHMIFTWCT